MSGILLISPDEQVLRRLRGVLQESGFEVSLSTSLEESFLETNPREPFLVLLDREALPEESWETQKILHWFRNRSPVWLLSQDDCLEVEEDYQRCLPTTVEKKTLLACIQKLRR